MRAPAGLLLSLFILAGSSVACQQNDPLPKEPARRQKSLSDRILDRVLRSDQDLAVQEDIALALTEVVITSDAPKLRLIVSKGSPVLARGAARALTRIRVLREPDRNQTLEECAKTETNSFVQAECANELKSGAALPAPTRSTRDVVALLESDDPEQRRSGLRLMLTSSLATAGDARLESALLHRLDDPDDRVRLLTNAVFLRRSLAASPLVTKEGSR